MRTLIGRLRNADRLRVEYGSLDVAHRVARLLVELAAQYGTSDTGGTEVGVPLSQQELAGMVATSRESMARALASLRVRRLIETGRRTITIVDLERLRRFAG